MSVYVFSSSLYCSVTFNFGVPTCEYQFLNCEKSKVLKGEADFYKFKLLQRFSFPSFACEWGSPGTPPRVRIPQTRNNSSSSNCCSNSCPWLWSREIARKWLFGLASIANASKQIEEMERDDVKSTFLVI